MKIKRVKKIYKGREVSLKFVEAEFGKKEIKKEVVEFPNTVAILPLISKDRIILVRQYRFPMKRELWEIPAGKLKKGERPEIGAKRELKEETGFLAKKLKKIAQFYLSPGYSSEYMTIFKAENLEKGNQLLDQDEIINKVKIFNLKEVSKMIKNKEIIDVKTILALCLLKSEK